MSKDAVQAVVLELESLPEVDQRRVLDFLALLKRHRSVPNAQPSIEGSHPALATKEGVLVFTGRIDAPEVDWTQVVREERDEDLMRAALGRTART